MKNSGSFFGWNHFRAENKLTGSFSLLLHKSWTLFGRLLLPGQSQLSIRNFLELACTWFILCKQKCWYYENRWRQLKRIHPFVFRNFVQKSGLNQSFCQKDWEKASIQTGRWIGHDLQIFGWVVVNNKVKQSQTVQGLCTTTKKTASLHEFYSAKKWYKKKNSEVLIWQLNFGQKLVYIFWPSKKTRFLLRKSLELKIWFHRTYSQDNHEKYQST